MAVTLDVIGKIKKNNKNKQKITKNIKSYKKLAKIIKIYYLLLF